MNATQERMFYAMHSMADKAGKAAVEAMEVEPMIVQSATQLYYVEDGFCGFAWVEIAGTTAFARWAKSHGLFKSHYPKGLSMWVSDYNQSMQRKEAYAAAYAEVLNKHNIKAYANSRMD